MFGVDITSRSSLVVFHGIMYHKSIIIVVTFRTPRLWGGTLVVYCEVLDNQLRIYPSFFIETSFFGKRPSCCCCLVMSWRALWGLRALLRTRVGPECYTKYCM